MRWPVLLSALCWLSIGAAPPQSSTVARSPDAPIPPVAPPAPTAVRIPLRDGTVLAGDLYRPAGPSRWPVIVEITPYGKRSDLTFINEREFWPAHGYAFLIVDVRGQHDSAGRFSFLVGGGADAYDTVEWAAAQSWSNGRIGMRGSSYSGTLPWYVAKAGAPHLRCINPNASVADPFDGPPYFRGAFMQQWALDWIGHLVGREARPEVKVDHAALLGHRPVLTMDEAAYGKPLPTYREVLSQQTRDHHWRSVGFTPADYARIRIPTLAFSGWYDGTLTGTVRHYRGMKRYSPAARDQWLVLGPWEHATAVDGGWSFATGERTSKVGNQSFPDNAFLPAQRMTLGFFDWCLKGEPRPGGASLRAYVVGADRWEEGDDFPASSQPRSYFLSGSGRLAAAPAAASAPDRYFYDPARPAPSATGARGGVGSATSRADTLTYSGEPLRAPLTLLGDVMLELHAASDARDTDFVARLEDVRPEGTAVQLGFGLVRARYRGGFERAVPLTPGRVERYRIGLGTIGYQVARGHHLRLSVTSSAYPMVTANPNTGNDIATDTAPPVVARQTVFHDRAHPSRLILPVSTR